MARKLRTDGWLFCATLLLVAAGIAWVYSASGESALVRRIMWIALGGVGLFTAMHVDYRRYTHPRVLPVLVGVTVVSLVAVLFFRPIDGSHRWIRFGELGLQPSEFAKLVVILFTAAGAARKLEANEPREPAFARALLLVGVLCLLVYKEPDAGSATVLAALAAAVIFAAGVPYRWVAGAALVAPVLGYVVLMGAGYRVGRLMAFLNPFADPLGDGYQPIQALIAVGTGGWWGKGYMAGVQRMGFLPMAHNDYIYGVIAEEKGLIGAALS